MHGAIVRSTGSRVSPNLENYSCCMARSETASATVSRATLATCRSIVDSWVVKRSKVGRGLKAQMLEVDIENVSGLLAVSCNACR